MKNDKFNNFKKKLIDFFKDPKEVISFFLPIIVAISLIIPVPYYIKLGGGTIKLDKKIEIENSYKSKGSLEALYVSEAKGVVLTYLLSYIVPSFEREKVSNVTLDNEDINDYNIREKYSFTSSLDSAVKVAFDSANRDVKVSSSSFIVLYIDKSANTNLKVGDVILSIDGKKISSYDDIKNIISSKKVFDKLDIVVLRDKKKVLTTTSLIEMDGEPKLGIVLANQLKYTSDPKVNFLFGDKQAGPSGGLMMTLSIYNKITKEDITKGRKVVGTGTIDLDGNVGEIGGVKYKLMAANRKKADIVLIPSGNYKEAYKLKKDKGYKFRLVKVDTFNDAVKYLKSS